MHIIGRLLAGLTLFTASHATLAWACSCAPASGAEHTDNADHVFVGTVTRVQAPGVGCGGTISSADPVTVTLEVEESFKGSDAATLDIVTSRDGASCGLSTAEGERWLIFANDDESGDLRASLCGGSIDVGDDDLEDIEALLEDDSDPF